MDLFDNLIKIKEYDLKGQLPDIFTFEDKRKLESKELWEERRKEIYRNAVELQYGTPPPEPEFVNVEPLNGHDKFMFFRVTTGKQNTTVSFLMMIVKPDGEGPFPTVIDGDFSFPYIYDKEFIGAFTENGIMPVFFNRIEIASDRDHERKSPIYRVYPDGNFGAIAAWAWGYSRCVDALETINFADKECIVFTGHSRGGKTALLAGALDERAVIVNPNESGCGGSGCYRLNIKAVTEDNKEETNETLKVMMNAFPHWLNPEMAKYIDKEEELPFDQHMLKALVAPRILFSSDAASDIWANPVGTWITNREARKLYEFLGVPQNMYWYFRKGYHAHKVQDINMLVNLIKHYKYNGELSPDFFKLPFKLKNI